MTVIDDIVYSGGNYHYYDSGLEEDFAGACYWINGTPVSLKGDGFDTIIYGLLWWWLTEEEPT